MSKLSHEHYLSTEGRFNPNWLEAVDSSIEGQKVWRFPYFIDFDGVRRDRVLEISEKVEPQPGAVASAEFVGRLATGWLVTVSANQDSYSIHLAREEREAIAQDTSFILAEATQITENATQEVFATAA